MSINCILHAVPINSNLFVFVSEFLVISEWRLADAVSACNSLKASSTIGRKICIVSGLKRMGRCREKFDQADYPHLLDQIQTMNCLKSYMCLVLQGPLEVATLKV